MTPVTFATTPPAGLTVHWFIPEAWDTPESPPAVRSTLVEVILTTVWGLRDMELTKVSYLADGKVFHYHDGGPGEPVWSIDLFDLERRHSSYVAGLKQ